MVTSPSQGLCSHAPQPCSQSHALYWNRITDYGRHSSPLHGLMDSESSQTLKAKPPHATGTGYQAANNSTSLLLVADTVFTITARNFIMLKEISKNSKFRNNWKNLALSPGNKTYFVFSARPSAVDSLMVSEHSPRIVLNSVFTFSISGGHPFEEYVVKKTYSKRETFLKCFFRQLNSNCRLVSGKRKPLPRCPLVIREVVIRAGRICQLLCLDCTARDWKFL